MAASSKHHVRNRILGGLGAVILVVVGLFMWQKTKVQLYDDPNTTGNTAGNLLNGVSFARQMAGSIMLIRMITILSM